MFTIKRNGIDLLHVRPASGEQRNEIMLTNTVSMAFMLNAAVQFAIGDTVEVFGETYYLSALPEPQKDSSIKHQYNLSFVAMWYRLGKPLFFFYDNLNELWQLSEFQLKCNAESASDLVIANANREQTGWVKGDVDATETKQLTFSGTETVLQALTQIAQEFNLEWWVINQTIHLTKKGDVDGFHWGAMWKRGNDWVFYGAGAKYLTIDDIQALGEIIEEESKNNGWSDSFKPY